MRAHTHTHPPTRTHMHRRTHTHTHIMYSDQTPTWEVKHTLHYITLHYITLHYITLHYITLHTYMPTQVHMHMLSYIQSLSLWVSMHHLRKSCSNQGNVKMSKVSFLCTGLQVNKFPAHLTFDQFNASLSWASFRNFWVKIHVWGGEGSSYNPKVRKGFLFTSTQIGKDLSHHSDSLTGCRAFGWLWRWQMKTDWRRKKNKKQRWIYQWRSSSTTCRVFLFKTRVCA